jgi:hypothetical protein
MLATGLVALAAGWGANVGPAGAVVTDTTPPVITVPADTTVSTNAASGVVVAYAASATDAVDGAVTPTCTPASGQTFVVGTTAVNCSATDTGANTATKSFNVTVVLDTTLPVITTPADTTVAPKSAAGAPVTYAATATDNLDGAITPTCAPASGQMFPLGATTVTCTAADKAGNVATKSFKVTVSTPTAPTITVPADRTVGAPSAAGDVVNYTVTATDAIDGTDPVNCAPPSGATFAVGLTTVVCTATNTAGKTSSKSFLVTVQPPEVPPTPPKAKISSAKTSSNLATVVLACSGDGTTICTFTVQLLAPGSGPGTLSKRRSLTLDGATTKTLRLRLTKTATAKLRKRHRLSSVLSLKQTNDDGTTTTKTRQLVFKH